MATTNLPVRLTSFIGRERGLEEVERLISTSRLATLTGAGRCGKTELAIQVADTFGDHFVDGVWCPEPNQPLNELLLNLVQSKHMLFILDNCEHLIGACSQLVQELLVAATGLNILASVPIHNYFKPLRAGLRSRSGPLR
jgi:predicted ATPase